MALFCAPLPTEYRHYHIHFASSTTYSKCNKNMYRQYNSITFSQKPEKSPVQPLLFPEIWILSCFNNQFYTARDDAASDCQLSTTSLLTMNDTARPARRPHEHIHVVALVSYSQTQFSRGRESLHGYIHLLLSPTAFDVDVACRSPTLSVIMASSAGQRHVVIAKLSPVIVRERPDWSLSWSPWMCPPRFINDMTHTRLTAGRSNTVEMSCVSVSGWWAWLLLV